MKIGEAHKTRSSSLQFANTIGAPRGDIGAPISTSVINSVRLTYFHTNRLLKELYKQEAEIGWRKDDGYIKKQTDIDRHSPVSPSTSSQPLDPPNFSLPTTFKGSDQWKMRGVEKLASVWRLYRTVAIDVCLFFYEAVVFSVTYFRFLFVEFNL